MLSERETKKDSKKEQKKGTKKERGRRIRKKSAKQLIQRCVNLYTQIPITLPEFMNDFFSISLLKKS